MKKLPTKVKTSLKELEYEPEYDDLDDTISDWLSDTYGFCHYGFDYEVDDKTGKIAVFDIKWDTSE